MANNTSISISSESYAMIKSSIDLCFEDFGGVAKSFRRDGRTFTFYKTSSETSLNDFGSDSVHNMLLNYLEVQNELNRQQKIKRTDKFRFEFNSPQEGDVIFTITFFNV